MMISNPVTTLATVSFLMGWTTAIFGAVILVHALFGGDHEASSFSLVDGILLLILGLMFIFGDFIHNTLILAYLLLFWIIVDSMLQLQFVITFTRGWVKWFMMAMDIMIIVFGISLLFQPSAVEGFLVFYIGWGFILTGVSKVVRVM